MVIPNNVIEKLWYSASNKKCNCKVIFWFYRMLKSIFEFGFYFTVNKL